MRLVSYTLDQTAHFGALHDRQIIDLPAAYSAWRRVEPAQAGLDGQPFPGDMLTWLAGGAAAARAAQGALAFAVAHLDACRALGLAVDEADERVRFLPPVPRPGKIICLGKNYLDHAGELGTGGAPAFPMLFAKYANTLVGHRQPIVLPRVSEQVDYEVELALVIGRTAKDVPAEQAFDIIAGYTCFNDVSVRDWQFRTAQFLQGKTFDHSGPIGPALLTTDEIDDIRSCELTTHINGEELQRGVVGNMIFDIPATIAYITQIMTLEPGDIIATGTPSGVGAARKPPRWLRAGDSVRVSVSGIGTLENPVVAPG